MEERSLVVGGTKSLHSYVKLTIYGKRVMVLSIEVDVNHIPFIVKVLKLDTIMVF